MKFELTVLGISAAAPAHGRALPAHVLQHHNAYFLIDCGEGTQFQFQKYSIRSSRINQIFISHLHGDHIFGLIGLLMSYDLAGRDKPIDVFSPPGLEPIIKVQAPNGFCFPVIFHETDPNAYKCVWESSLLRVFTIPLKHRVPCNGYLFEEKPRLMNMRKEAIVQYNIPYQQIPDIKLGADFTQDDGSVVPNAELTVAPLKPRRFAYCSDTVYDRTILPFIKGVDLLYHEATFMQDLLEQAKQTMHTTAAQAAMLAKEAECKYLLMGHISSRYSNVDKLELEAQCIMPEAAVAQEGTLYVI